MYACCPQSGLSFKCRKIIYQWSLVRLVQLSISLVFLLFAHLGQYKSLWNQCASWCLNSQSGTEEKGNHPRRKGEWDLHWTEAPQIPLCHIEWKLGFHLKKPGRRPTFRQLCCRGYTVLTLVSGSIQSLSWPLTFTASFSQSWLSSRSKWMSLREMVCPFLAHLLQFKLACGE